MIITSTFDIIFHSNPFCNRRSTAIYIMPTSSIPVASLHPKKEIISLVILSVLLLWNTKYLFVTKANITANTQDMTVDSTFGICRISQQR